MKKTRKKMKKKEKLINILLLKNMIIMKQLNNKFKFWKLKALKCHIKDFNQIGMNNNASAPVVDDNNDDIIVENIFGGKLGETVKVGKTRTYFRK